VLSWPARARPGRRDAESGVSAIEFVLLTPILFFLIFSTVQFGMFYFARHVAIAAAQEGDRVAREEAGQPGVSVSTWENDADTTSQNWVTQLAPYMTLPPGSPAAKPARVDGLQGATVTVTANVPLVMPWLHMSTTAVSTGPIEQFIPDGN
jgi:Flp pilus assembly protein TadG